MLPSARSYSRTPCYDIFSGDLFLFAGILNHATSSSRTKRFARSLSRADTRSGTGFVPLLVIPYRNDGAPSSSSTLTF
ncbi:hypothetical protein LshimejAT787_1102650 [Lyophyllum shimeji]|uniref:Uncharacterized protein n=1 Tax=Lyophyllum shimeji TaxID=47721 RepID=A0A9P3USB0_LYOSH|nr:hypothetical protein LshimejAT787_1102650 [Lyophyllum shimeji]